MVKIDKKWCYFHLKWCYLHLRWCYLRRWLGCSIDFAFSVKKIAENPKTLRWYITGIPRFLHVWEQDSRLSHFTYLKCQQRSLFLLGFPAKYSSSWFILAWHHNRIYMIYMHTSCLKICNGQTAVPNYIHIYFHRALYLIVQCIFGWDW